MFHSVGYEEASRARDISDTARCMIGRTAYIPGQLSSAPYMPCVRYIRGFGWSFRLYRAFCTNDLRVDKAKAVEDFGLWVVGCIFEHPAYRDAHPFPLGDTSAIRESEVLQGTSTTSHFTELDTLGHIFICETYQIQRASTASTPSRSCPSRANLHLQRGIWYQNHPVSPHEGAGYTLYCHRGCRLRMPRSGHCGCVSTDIVGSIRGFL